MLRVWFWVLYWRSTTRLDEYSLTREDAAEEVIRSGQEGPQRLKPDCKCGTYGTDKSVPLTKTDFSASSEAQLVAET